MLRHALPEISKLEYDLFTAFGTYVVRNCLIVFSETDTPFDEFNYVFIVPRPWLDCGRFFIWKINFKLRFYFF